MDGLRIAERRMEMLADVVSKNNLLKLLFIVINVFFILSVVAILLANPQCLPLFLC